MGKLIYAAITSLDGYTADDRGDFTWGAPDEEVHAFVNDLERRIGTALYGRRMYEVMVAWETPQDFAEDSAVLLDYAAVWQATEKIVYSRTLAAPSSARTRIERNFDAGDMGQLKSEAETDLSIGGAEIAAEALRQGLVDEVSLFVAPVVVGGGTRALPPGVRLDLELHTERRFGNGMVYLAYAVR